MVVQRVILSGPTKPVQQASRTCLLDTLGNQLGSETPRMPGITLSSTCDGIFRSPVPLWLGIAFIALL